MEIDLQYAWLKYSISRVAPSDRRRRHAIQKKKHAHVRLCLRIIDSLIMMNMSSLHYSGSFIGLNGMWTPVPQIAAQPSDKRTTELCLYVKTSRNATSSWCVTRSDVGKHGRKRVRFFTRRESSQFDRGGGRSMRAVNLHLTEPLKQAATGRVSFVMNNWERHIMNPVSAGFPESLEFADCSKLKWMRCILYKLLNIVI